MNENFHVTVSLEGGPRLGRTYPACQIDTETCDTPDISCAFCRSKKERLSALYPVGTRVVLDKMDDIQAPPVGTKGTVEGIDDLGDLLMRWDTGSSLKLIYGKDEFHTII